MRTHLPALVLLLATSGPLGAAAPPPPVKIDVVPYLAYAPIFVAHDKGYFRDEGVAVELVPLTSQPAMAALVGKKIDVFCGQLTAGLFNAIAGGAKLAIVADKGHVAVAGAGCAYDGFLIRPALAADATFAATAAGLKGRKACVHPYGILDFLFDRLLKKAGAARSDLSVTYLEPATAMEAFRRGALDLRINSEPVLTRARLDGDGVVWMTAVDVAPGQQTAAIVFGPRLLGPDRDQGRRFLAAYLRAVREINRGKTPELIRLVARRTELPESVVREGCWGALDDDGEIDVPSVITFQEWAKGRGLQDSVVPAERFWDPSFLNAVSKPAPAAR